MIQYSRAHWRPPMAWQVLIALATLFAALLLAGAALAHNVTEGDAGYVQEVTGFRPIAFIYLGAKHMVTARPGKKRISQNEANKPDQDKNGAG